MAETLASTRAKLEALTGQADLGDPSLLATPSPRHLRKIFAAVSAATGFGAGPCSVFFNGEGSEVGDEEFFTRLLHLVAFSLDVPEPTLFQISASALVKGTDPAAAHKLLQKLVEVASSREARTRVARGDAHASRENHSETGAKQMSATRLSASSCHAGHQKRPGDGRRLSSGPAMTLVERQRKWHDRLRILPGFSVDESDQEAWAVRQNLASLVARLEELAEETINASRLAGLDVETVCQTIKEEVFGWNTWGVSTSGNRSMSSYAYKHIHSHPKEMYEIGAEVGAGAFGSVVQATHRQTQEVHAVKCLPKGKVNNEALWEELDMVRHLDHPNIMRMYNTFEDETTMYMCSELCVGGPFFDTLAKAGCLEEDTACRLFKQIIGVVTYLHSRSICHRDIKPENFLVLRQADVKNLHLKLIDFGTAKRFDLSPMVTKVCTPHYVAPEVLTPQLQPYTEKVDVWSCGVMLFTMLSGRLPFHRDNNLELLKLVKKGRFEFEPKQVWSSISDTAQDLISQILTVKPENRITADEATHHNWCVNRMLTNDESDDRINKQLIEGMHRFLTNNRLKRVALRIIARQIDDDSIQRLRSIFLSMDADNSGTLTVDEMTEAAHNIDEVGEMARDGMVEIMCQLDPTGSGTVEYTEFLAASMSKEQYLKEDVCKAAFVRLDSDGDGILTRKDLGRLLSDRDGMRDAGLTGASLTELISELDHIMDEADMNHDGGVSFEEFMELMNDDGPLPQFSAMQARVRRGSCSKSNDDTVDVYLGVVNDAMNAKESKAEPTYVSAMSDVDSEFGGQSDNDND